MEPQRQTTDIVIGSIRNFSAPSHPFQKTPSSHLSTTWSAVSFWHPVQEKKEFFMNRPSLMALDCLQKQKRMTPDFVTFNTGFLTSQGQ
ncbi:hypothetical protein AYI68_g7675 [Smittium mucronatum]|uniref:Uncharacterized protein n=1 Tax=Smittium mucronatum TaxID=133383 RepID=A0A1R0GN34_9FUNG|nr:hypothetical protein AYI68_g7675 [Smittium mucronatum]